MKNKILILLILSSCINSSVFASSLSGVPTLPTGFKDEEIQAASDEIVDSGLFCCLHSKLIFGIALKPDLTLRLYHDDHTICKNKATIAAANAIIGREMISDNF